MVELARSPFSAYPALTRKKVVAAIPCYNTQHSITKVVTKAKQYVDEVIVIDDGSTDMTSNVAKAAGALVTSHGKNKGYGEAIKSCFTVSRASNADIMVIIDGDGQHDPDEIPRLLEPVFLKEANLVIGSRFLSPSENMPHYRKFGIRIINMVWNFGSKIKVTDTQSGFRAYGNKLIKELNITMTGMDASIEILEKARRAGLKIIEVPITCSYYNNNSTISIKAFIHGFSVVFSVLKIRLKSIFSEPYLH